MTNSDTVIADTYFRSDVSLPIPPHTHTPHLPGIHMPQYQRKGLCFNTFLELKSHLLVPAL